jgi:hypothetical protein
MSYDEYSEGGPFSRLYEEWIQGPPDNRDPALTQRIAETYREAWRTGDRADRSMVLLSIMLRRDAAGADIVIDGLRSEDYQIAADAFAVASVLVSLYGINLGSDMPHVGYDLVWRHPALESLRWSALRRPDLNTDERFGPFFRLFDEWKAAEESKPTIEQQIAATYRQAWESNDEVERSYVIHAVVSLRDRGGTDLLLEALQSPSAKLVRTALAWVGLALKWGFDLGPNLPELLLAIPTRLPGFESSVRFSLWDLDDLEGGR